MELSNQVLVFNFPLLTGHSKERVRQKAIGEPSWSNQVVEPVIYWSSFLVVRQR